MTKKLTGSQDERVLGPGAAEGDVEKPAGYAAHDHWAGPGDWEVERRMRRKLAERGWLALAWPKEYGGQGASYMKDNN